MIAPSRHLAVFLAIFGFLAMAGCTTLVAPPYAPDYSMIDQLKRERLRPVAVDESTPTDPEASVNRITLRGAPFRPPSGTFADYLTSAIRSDLADLGILDPRSDRKIHAQLLRNELDVSGIVTGEGRIAILLTITKAGARVFEREYQADTSFESSFMAAIAVPKGQSEYPRLVRALLARVYTDPAFLAALR